MFLVQPMHLMAGEAVPAGGDLTKRQTQCETGFLPCKDFPTSCCKFLLRTCRLDVNQSILLTRLLAGNLGTFCVQIGDQVGCCPDGQTCDSITCQSTQTACGSYCCDADMTCTTDSSGSQSCSSSTSSNTTTTDQVCGGLSGYVQCTNMDGCCPKGVTCVPPKSCDISCGPDDPVCGDGCCSNGQVCQSDLTCGLATSGGSFSPLVSPTASSNLNSTSPTESATTTKHTTKRTTVTLDSTSATPSGGNIPTVSDSLPTTASRKTLVSTQSVTPNNAAPLQTMAALLGGGLGIAVGYLAM